MNKQFEEIKAYGKYVRENKLNGLDSWNSKKKQLLEELIVFDKWNIEDIEGKYKFVHDELGMKGDDFDEKTENWEKFHFFLQHFRIPKNNKPDSLRLMQIAYNAGQLEACFEDKVFDGAREFYLKNRLGCIETYIV